MAPGPSEVTAVLRHRWAASPRAAAPATAEAGGLRSFTGVDISPAMLDLGLRRLRQNVPAAAGLADARAESPLETLGRLRIIGSGLPAPELQVELHDARGFVARVDGWYEEAAVAVEFDGLVKYADPHDGRSPAQVHWDEKRREDRVRDLDVRLVRVARADLGPSWPRVHARLAALLATPFVGPRRFTTVRRPNPSTRSA